MSKFYYVRTGGSTKGIKMMGVSAALSEKHTFDVIASASVTAITSILEAMKRFDIIKEAMMSFTKETMWGKDVPFIGGTLIPTPRAIWRLITGKGGLGSFDTLRTTISEFMTKELFEEWQQNCKTDVLIYCFCLEDNEIVEFDLRKFNYEETLALMIASSSVPFITPAVKFRGKHYCDIGFFHPNASFEIFKKYDDVASVISLYNREQKDKRFPVIRKFFKSIFPLLAQKEFYDSKLAEEMEMKYCLDNGISYKSIAIGKTEVDSYSDAGTIEEKIIDWNNGYEIGKNF